MSIFKKENDNLANSLNNVLEAVRTQIDALYGVIKYFKDELSRLNSMLTDVQKFYDVIDEAKEDYKNISLLIKSINIKIAKINILIEQLKICEKQLNNDVSTYEYNNKYHRGELLYINSYEQHIRDSKYLLNEFDKLTNEIYVLYDEIIQFYESE